ncbi:hypothetical protein J6590_101893 [Homalodisca vitripennis]|nr:hypothetical protein J6590_101893 [Homalodisca vitripennis]
MPGLQSEAPATANEPGRLWPPLYYPDSNFAHGDSTGCHQNCSSGGQCGITVCCVLPFKMDEFDEEYENEVDEAIEEVVVEVVHCLSEELQELLKSNRSCWVKDWVGRRCNLRSFINDFKRTCR